MKRFLCALLIVVIAISLICVFCSCGSNDDEVYVIDSTPADIGGVTFDTQTNVSDNDVSESKGNTEDSTSNNENTEETIPYGNDKESGYEEIYPAD